MTCDINKPVRTRDGQSVQILHINLEGVYPPIVALITDSEDNATVEIYSLEGVHSEDDRKQPSPRDLVNYGGEKYINVWRLEEIVFCSRYAYDSIEDAEAYARTQEQTDFIAIAMHVGQWDV